MDFHRLLFAIFLHERDMRVTLLRMLQDRFWSESILSLRSFLYPTLISTDSGKFYVFRVLIVPCPAKHAFCELSLLLISEQQLLIHVSYTRLLLHDETCSLTPATPHDEDRELTIVENQLGKDEYQRHRQYLLLWYGLPSLTRGRIWSKLLIRSSAELSDRYFSGEHTRKTLLSCCEWTLHNDVFRHFTSFAGCFLLNTPCQVEGVVRYGTK